MGPLNGLRIVEFQGLGPCPFAGMILADLGAEVISITRKFLPEGKKFDNDVADRGKRSLNVNLKDPQGIDLVLELIKKSDAVIEGFRPGVMEKLGLGPEQCLGVNKKLVYGRMTGWGQSGPLAKTAGHDINYISLSGALYASGRAGGKPTPAMNLVGDYGGGGMLLALGVVSALWECTRSGEGQVVDASMVEGSALLMHLMYSLWQNGTWNWQDERGVNVLDTGAHFYDTYETSDNKFLSVGPLEPQFYREFIEKVDLDWDDFKEQFDAENWPKMKEAVGSAIKAKTRDEWCDIFEGSDACVAPVLSMREAPLHPHNIARKSFVTVGGHVQPAPAPKFSRSKRQSLPHPAPRPGSDTADILLKYCGVTQDQLVELRDSLIIRS